jgi:hypothetical protein
MERIRQRKGKTYINRHGVHTAEGQRKLVDSEATPKHVIQSGNIELPNPFAYMNSVQAQIALYLEDKGVAFAFEYFADNGECKTLHKLIPAYFPDFCIPAYKLCIMIEGNFSGTLPAVVNSDALAEVLLHKDGWKGVIWTSDEVIHIGVPTLIQQDAPALVAPTILGPPIQNPYAAAQVTYADKKRKHASGQALMRGHTSPKDEGVIEEGNTRGMGSSRRNRKHVSVGDFGRIRTGIKTSGDKHQDIN